MGNLAARHQLDIPLPEDRIYDGRNNWARQEIILCYKGQYSDHLLAYDAIEGLEIREDSGEEYRGFDRDILLAELVKLRDGAK